MSRHPSQVGGTNPGNHQQQQQQLCLGQPPLGQHQQGSERFGFWEGRFGELESRGGLMERIARLYAEPKQANKQQKGNDTIGSDTSPPHAIAGDCSSSDAARNSPDER